MSRLFNAYENAMLANLYPSQSVTPAGTSPLDESSVCLVVKSFLPLFRSVVDATVELAICVAVHVMLTIYVCSTLLQLELSVCEILHVYYSAQMQPTFV